MTTFTVTATQGGATSAGMLMRIKVLTQAAVSQTGATASQNGAAAHQAAITTTQAGSQVYASLFDVGAVALTANAQTTLFDNNAGPGDGITHGDGRSILATVTPGSITIGASAPADAGLCSLAEILAAGTITEDASSPAPVTVLATAVTTASFTPPASALLVAMVNSNGGAGVLTISMSDTSGLSLTWREKANINPSSAGYAGVWIAQLPASALPGITVITDERRPAKKFSMLGV